MAELKRQRDDHLAFIIKPHVSAWPQQKAGISMKCTIGRMEIFFHDQLIGWIEETPLRPWECSAGIEELNRAVSNALQCGRFQANPPKKSMSKVKHAQRNG
ncbi:hypothetical protein K7Y63_004172 [Serratia marcescens]